MSLATQFPTLFWDVDPASVDEQRHVRFVIERVLEHGTLDSVGALLRTYPRAEIIDAVRTSRRISRTTGLFWQAYFSSQEPIACLSPPCLNRPSAPWE